MSGRLFRPAARIGIGGVEGATGGEDGMTAGKRIVRQGIVSRPGLARAVSSGTGAMWAGAAVALLMSVLLPFAALAAQDVSSASGRTGDVRQACMTAVERTAWRTRVLQTQMMIGALQCRGRRAAGQREGYNRFVLRYRPVLKTQAAVFVAFVRRRAAAGAHAVDREVTRIANELSLAAQADPDFCARIAAFGAAITAEDPPGLGALFALMPLALEPPLPLCGAGAAGRVADE